MHPTACAEHQVDGLGDHAARAVAHVAALCDGPPLPRDLRVTVAFHPDRLVGGVTVLEQLASEGRYRSQFETGVSNGGLTAYPGGDRWRWESRLFGGAYDAAPASARPVYGALDRHRSPYGAALRFGSAHLRLREDVLPRTTFCYPDSVLEPSDLGVAAAMRLLALAEADDAAGTLDALDDYVEAQVHGPVLLARDVEAVVLDPAFRGTAVDQVAASLPCPVQWHPGLVLEVGTLARQAAYRGPEVVDLGQQVARDGLLDARVVGEAAASGRHDPQRVKQLWHCVARFGRARAEVLG